MTSRTDFIILPEADRDIEEILQYTIERWGDDQADAYWNTIWEAAQQIRAFPSIGRPRPQSDEREYILPHHLIVYWHDVDRDRIEIRRLVSHRRGRRR